MAHYIKHFEQIIKCDGVYQNTIFFSKWNKCLSDQIKCSLKWAEVIDFVITWNPVFALYEFFMSHTRRDRTQDIPLLHNHRVNTCCHYTITFFVFITSIFIKFSHAYRQNNTANKVQIKITIVLTLTNCLEMSHYWVHCSIWHLFSWCHVSYKCSIFPSSFQIYSLWLSKGMSIFP